MCLLNYKFKICNYSKCSYIFQLLSHVEGWNLKSSELTRKANQICNVECQTSKSNFQTSIKGQDAILHITNTEAACRHRHQELITFNKQKTRSALRCKARESEHVLKDKLQQVIMVIIPITLCLCSSGVFIFMYCRCACKDDSPPSMISCAWTKICVKS